MDHRRDTNHLLDLRMTSEEGDLAPSSWQLRGQTCELALSSHLVPGVNIMQKKLRRKAPLKNNKTIFYLKHACFDMKSLQNIPPASPTPGLRGCQ